MLVTLNLCTDPPPLRKKMRAGGSEGGGVYTGTFWETAHLPLPQVIIGDL